MERYENVTNGLMNGLDKIKATREFMGICKVYYVGCKGKACLPAIKRTVKELKAKKYLASYHDAYGIKDDSVELYYV